MDAATNGARVFNELELQASVPACPTMHRDAEMSRPRRAATWSITKSWLFRHRGDDMVNSHHALMKVRNASVRRMVFRTRLGWIDADKVCSAAIMSCYEHVVHTAEIVFTKLLQYLSIR